MSDPVVGTSESDAGADSTSPGGTGTGGTAGSSSTENLGGTGGTGEDSSSDSDRKIKSGTVLMAVEATSTPSCEQLLQLTNPVQSLVGFSQKSLSAYQNDARSKDDPDTIYLVGGKDAVILPGPTLDYGASVVDEGGARLTTCLGEGNNDCIGLDGYYLKVDDRLSYLITITDWEEEIALGQVQLCNNSGNLTSQFVFAGLGELYGGGVAHDVTITPILDRGRIPGTPTTPVDIECRVNELW